MILGIIIYPAIDHYVDSFSRFWYGVSLGAIASVALYGVMRSMSSDMSDAEHLGPSAK